MTFIGETNHVSIKLIEELVHALFDNCHNDPRSFATIFDHSNIVIGYSYSCREKKFTHFSDSLTGILGYNLNNILINGNFNGRIVHPQDRVSVHQCLKKDIISIPKSLNRSINSKFRYVKFRARHIRGYWKYLILFAQDYFNETENTLDKMGVIVNERIDKLNGSSFNRQLDSTNDICQNQEEKQSIISPREHEILELISNGLKTKEIAIQLHISDSTVVTHRKHLITKMNVHNTAELIKVAAQRVLI